MTTGQNDIPVNHYKLCDGIDPHEGEDKFLTVTMSDTVRQGSRLSLDWMNVAKSREWPWAVFTVQKVTADAPSSDSKITYKNKLRMVLTNATGKNIYVWTPLWDSPEVLQDGVPLGARFRLEASHGQWVQDESGKAKEYECLDLRPNATVDCYIGLLPPSGQSIERRLQTRTPIGTATFPVKIEGKLYEVPIKL